MAECPACGGEHPPGPTGEPGTAFAGIEILVCPNLPEQWVYFDVEYERGPNGATFDLRELADG